MIEVYVVLRDDDGGFVNAYGNHQEAEAVIARATEYHGVPVTHIELVEIEPPPCRTCLPTPGTIYDGEGLDYTCPACGGSGVTSPSEPTEGSS